MRQPSHIQNKNATNVKELSKGLSFARVNLYETEKNTYFGEVIFYPMSGMGSFHPEQYNELLGQMIKLPSENRGNYQ